MRKKTILFFLLPVLLVLVTINSKEATIHVTTVSDHLPGSLGEAIKAQTAQNNPISKLGVSFREFPLHFIANQGQLNEKVKFYSRTSNYTLWLTKEELVFDSIKKEEQKTTVKPSIPTIIHEQNKAIPWCRRDVSKLVFLNANKNPELIPEEITPMKINFLIGNDRSKWQGNIPTSSAVKYKSLYQNIDLKVYGNEKQIEYDWIIKPGGNPGDIRFAYRNIKKTYIDKKGNLFIETDFGKIMHKKPTSYQVIESKKKKVEVTFKKAGRDTYDFAVGTYDRTRELIIDPLIVRYSTYLGGSHDEWIGRVAVDSNECAYILGETTSYDFPVLNHYQLVQWDHDMVITKIDTTKKGTSSLIFSTYLGGYRGDTACNIAADESGCVYIIGWTGSSDFPILNAYQSEVKNVDTVIAKIDTTKAGAACLLYSTYLGGTGVDLSGDIAVDQNECVYVTGITDSSDFPVLNAFQANRAGKEDVFVAKIDTTKAGTDSLIYSTYLGGANKDEGNGIEVDRNGYAYVAGATLSADFPLSNAFQSVNMGWDVFITKLDTKKSGCESLLYSTYLGGKTIDYNAKIAVDNNECAYIAGYTASSDFPVMNAYQPSKAGNSYDIFVTKIDTTKTGTACLLYSTFLGGTNWEDVNAIAVSQNRYACVAGVTVSSDFPTLNSFQLRMGARDAFISRIDTSGSGYTSLIYSTYLGGSNNDSGYGIAIDSSECVYAAGSTLSRNFPTWNSYSEDLNGYHPDLFLTKFSLLELNCPNGGENWTMQTTQNISWNVNGSVVPLKISLWQNGNLVGIIADNIASVPSFYTWTVGRYIGGISGPGNGYQIRIKEKGNMLHDMSSDVFTITPPIRSITVTSPNGGEKWKLGTLQNITWNAVNLTGNLIITLVKDGRHFAVIARDVNPAPGTFSWHVGQLQPGIMASGPGSGFKVKISEMGTSVSDESNLPFAIQ